MQISSEPGLRGELLASGADKAPLISDPLAVWSEATRLMISSFPLRFKGLGFNLRHLRNLRQKIFDTLIHDEN